MVFGGVAAVGIVFLIKVRGTLQSLNGTLCQKIRLFDPIGNIVFSGAILSLLFALHWGGWSFAYDSPRIITLFTLFGVLTIAFIVIEALQVDRFAIGMFSITCLSFADLASILSTSQMPVGSFRSFIRVLRWRNHLSHCISSESLVPGSSWRQSTCFCR